MKIKLLVGWGISIFLSTGCVDKEPKANIIVKNEKKQVVIDKKNKQKINFFIINLDKEIKEDGLKGGVFDTIKGIIPMGHNDEVSFVGKRLFIATPIKLYINNTLKETIENFKEIFMIKGSDVNNGDTITIKNRFGVKMVEKEIIKK